MSSGEVDLALSAAGTMSTNRPHSYAHRLHYFLKLFIKKYKIKVANLPRGYAGFGQKWISSTMNFFDAVNTFLS
jgi:hypothetical protein